VGVTCYFHVTSLAAGRQMALALCKTRCVV
jgi:hypothetical protein